METRLVAMNSDLAVVAAAAESHSEPSTGAHGIDLTTWKTGGHRGHGGAHDDFGHDSAMIYLDHATGGTITVTGAEVWGYDATDTKWRYIGVLFGGLDITLKAGKGFAQGVRDIGTFDRLAVKDTGTGGTTHLWGAKPIEEL